ncbi:hypothetical protein BDK51DRAFT_30723 [Blyttiomyces helicus]|uniref:BAH domain-containing protein n=1 Tax=Blyttiomyces helicus TaxID=388810 RepID=A0A4P9WEF0_9FUNG|nr:hypothetical protein BDK51DRAFT_30723 [Blyttiomyces helicus]|eukprot:RKO88766.1 hypothetical protein BDK51DRAFT_30723 [Blyttiomyces helicus]
MLAAILLPLMTVTAAVPAPVAINAAEGQKQMTSPEYSRLPERCGRELDLRISLRRLTDLQRDGPLKLRNRCRNGWEDHTCRPASGKISCAVKQAILEASTGTVEGGRSGEVGSRLAGLPQTPSQSAGTNTERGPCGKRRRPSKQELSVGRLFFFGIYQPTRKSSRNRFSSPPQFTIEVVWKKAKVAASSPNSPSSQSTFERPTTVPVQPRSPAHTPVPRPTTKFAVEVPVKQPRKHVRHVAIPKPSTAFTIEVVSDPRKMMYGSLPTPHKFIDELLSEKECDLEKDLVFDDFVIEHFSSGKMRDLSIDRDQVQDCVIVGTLAERHGERRFRCKIVGPWSWSMSVLEATSKDPPIWITFALPGRAGPAYLALGKPSIRYTKTWESFMTKSTLAKQIIQFLASDPNGKITAKDTTGKAFVAWLRRKFGSGMGAVDLESVRNRELVQFCSAFYQRLGITGTPELPYAVHRRLAFIRFIAETAGAELKDSSLLADGVKAEVEYVAVTQFVKDVFKDLLDTLPVPVKIISADPISIASKKRRRTLGISVDDDDDDDVDVFVPLVERATDPAILIINATKYTVGDDILVRGDGRFQDEGEKDLRVGRIVRFKRERTAPGRYFMELKWYYFDRQTLLGDVFVKLGISDTRQLFATDRSDLWPLTHIVCKVKVHKSLSDMLRHAPTTPIEFFCTSFFDAGKTNALCPVSCRPPVHDGASLRPGDIAVFVVRDDTGSIAKRTVWEIVSRDATGKLMGRRFRRWAQVFEGEGPAHRFVRKESVEFVGDGEEYYGRVFMEYSEAGEELHLSEAIHGAGGAFFFSSGYRLCSGTYREVIYSATQIEIMKREYPSLSGPWDDQENKSTVFDLFGGVGGLAMGLEIAGGVQVRGVLDNDPTVLEAYDANRVERSTPLFKICQEASETLVDIAAAGTAKVAVTFPHFYTRGGGGVQAREVSGARQIA